jgi:hypothetical protein
MTRFRASTIHLAISAAVVAVILSIVFLFWYPGSTFEISGAMRPMFVLVGVDLVLGPLLTLIVYKQGKPGLLFDLWFIALVQISALVYGSYALNAGRPHYMVFSVDRITLVTNQGIDPSAIRYEELAEKPLRDVVRVFARAPSDPLELERLMDSVIFEGQPDLERRTEYWEPWSSGSETIRDAIVPLGEFESASELEQQAIVEALDRFSADHPNLGILPIGGIEDDIGMLMDMDTLADLDVIRVNPW